MTTSETLTGARTMWELVERRAQTSPDHPLLIAADGEMVTFGQFADRVERVAAGLPDLGIRPDPVSWQLPTRIDTWSCRWPSPGSVPFRSRSSSSTASARSASRCARPGPSCSSFPAPGAASTTPRWPRGLPPPTDRTTARHRDGLPEGDPAVLPPPPTRTPRRTPPLDLLHLRHDRRPEGRAAHRRDADRRRLGSRRRTRHGARRRRLHRLPVRAHRRPRLSGHHAAVGFPASCSRRSRLPTRYPFPPPRRHHGGRSTAFYRAYLASSASARRPDPADPAAYVRRRRAQAARALLEVRDEIGGPGVAHGYGMTEVPMITTARRTTPTSSSPTPRDAVQGIASASST